MTIRRPAQRLVAFLTDLASRTRHGSARLLVVLVAIGVAAACGETTGPTPDVISAAHSTVTVTPNTPVAAGGTATVTVQLRNADGGAIRVSDADVHVTASGGTMGPITSNGDGRYSATVTTTVAGTVTLTATVNGQAIPGSVAVPFVAGPAATVAKVSGDLQTGVVGTALAVAPSVRVTDAYGNLVTGTTVTFATAAGSGTVSPASVSTNASGAATVTGWVLGSAVGTHSMTATVTGLPAVAFAATATAGAAAELVKTAGDLQTADAGTNVPVAPALLVRDAFGNPRGGVAVTFAVTSGGGSVVAASTTSGPDGTIALQRWTLGTSAGANTITASATGVPTVTFTAHGRSGAAATITKVAGDAQSAVAGEAVAVAPSVRVADQYGNPVEGVAVRWAVASGNGAVMAASTTSDTLGIAASPTWTLGPVVGANTLSATANALAGVTFTATGTPGSAAALTRTAGDGQSAVAGSAVAAAPQVRVTDARGNAVPSAAVTFAVASGDGSTTGASVTSDANGLATVGSWTLGRIAGTNTLTATSGSASTTFSATGVAGAPTIIVKMAGDAQVAVAGAATATAAAIELRDANGNRVPGIAVSFAVTQGGGTLAPSATATDANGAAVAGAWTLGNTMGANALTVSAAGLTTTFTATGIAGAAVKLVKQAGDAQTAVAGSTLAARPSVLVTDAHDNPVPGAAVTFAVTSGGGTASGASVNAGADGIATVGSWTLGATAGANTLSATSGSLPPVTFTATGVAGNVATMTIAAGDGQGATVGTSVAEAPAVLLKDANGNPVAGQAVTFAVASGGGSLGATSGTSNASGVATGGTWTLGTTAGANTVTATSGALQVTFTATGLVGPAAVMQKAQGDGQSAAAGTTVATAPAVRIADANGNPIAGATVTFAAGGGGSVTGSPATTGADGIARLGSWTLATTAGANTLTATSGALSVSFGATGTAGAAAGLTKTAGDAQVATVGTAVGTAPAVRLADASGNPIAGASVTFAVTGGGGSITGGAATTNAGGIATLGGWTLGTTAGANTLTATAGSLVATFSATGTAGTASGLAIAAGDAQTATVGTSVATAPAVRVTDQYGNPVAGASVSFAAGNGGSVAGSPVVSNASGIATLGSWTLGSTPGAQTLTATLGSASVTFAATATAGGAANLVKSAGDAQTATVGTAVAVAPSVTLTDALGNPVAGVTVEFAPVSGGGTLGGFSTTTNASGVATLGSWTLGTAAGPNSITATAGSLSVTFTATGTAGAASNLTKSAGDAQSATVGTAVAVAPAVTVTDAFGNPVAGVTVEFAPVSGGGTLGGFSTTTNASGVATLGSWTLGTAAGPNSITATAGSLSVTFSATGTAGAATTLTKSAGDAQSATAGTAVTVSPRVLITDAYGNPITGRAVTFAVGTGGGSITGANATTDALGFATLGSWTLGATGSNTLTASSSGLTTVTFSATATAPPPALIEIVQGDAQTASVGAAVATLPRVRVKDASGNVLAGVTVNFAVAGGNGSITGATATTDASGLATVGSWTLGNGGTSCSAFQVTSCSRNALTASATTGSAAPVSFKAYVPPFAFSGTYQTVGNATVSVPAANGLLFGALSINGDGPNGTGATLSLVGGTAPAGTTITRSADGSFSMQVRAASGNVSYGYAVGDGIAATNTAVTATLNVGTAVWYLQQGATAAGADGSDTNPYNSLATLEANASIGANAIILVKNASNTNIPGGTLKAGQTLYGQYASSPYTYTTGSTATYRNGNQTLTLLTNGGLTLMDGVVLSTGNTIAGINIQNATGTGITGSSFGVLTVNRVSVNSAGGALDLSTGTVVGTFTDVSSAGGTYGVSLNNVATSGTVDLGSGNLTGASTGAFRVVGAGTPSQNLHNLIYFGTLSQTGAGRVIDIQNHAGGSLTLAGNVFCSSSCLGMQVTGATGGTVTLSGATKQLFAASGNIPVALTNNTFTAIDFINGGLNVSGNGATGFYGNSGGTVTVTGTGNVFSGSSGKALDLTSTTIGAAGITAQSISASGGLNGIALNTTGSLGSLTVTGNGGTCSSAGTCTGGAIQSTSGSGIFLSGTLAPSFNQMYVGGARVHGVGVSGVNGFTFTNGMVAYSGMTTGSVVTGIGTENNIDIADATGTVSITGNSLTNALNHGVSVTSGSSTLPSLTISNNTFTSGTTTTLSKGSAVSIAMTSSGSFSGNVIAGAISGNTITGFPSGKGISITATNANTTGMAGVGIPSGGTAISTYAGPQVLTVSGNQIAGISAANRMGSNAISVSATGRAQSNVSITGNGTAAAPVRNMASSAIFVNAAGTIANVYANVANNYLSPNGASGGGIEAYSTQSAAATDAPLLSLVATGNAITNSFDNGIRLAANQAAGRLFARVENNTIAAPIGTAPSNYGIYVQSSSTGASNVCLRLRSNTTAGGTSSGITSTGIGLARSATGTFGLDGLTPSPAATPTVENYVNSLNSSASGSAGVGVGGTELRLTTTGYTSCTSAP